MIEPIHADNPAVLRRIRVTGHIAPIVAHNQ